METQEADDLTDDDDVADHRERAKAEIDQTARQTKQALIDADIDLGIFFMVPNSGRAIVSFGTPGNPSDDEWDRVGKIVGSIVAQSIGLERVRCRPVTCATTDSIADHQPTESPAQPAEPSGFRPMPSSALQHSGAESR